MTETRPTILDRLSIVAGNLHELAKGDANQDLIAELENLDRIVLDMATEMREVADPAIRQQVAEQIAQALDARAAAWTTPNPVPEGWDSHHLIVRGASELANDNAAKIAREIGGKG
jgi:hypothetical protein